MTRSLVAALRAAGCVFAEDEARLLAEAAGSLAQLAALLARRVDGEPLEQVLGWAEFRGLRIVVEPGVFVPRRRTGFLVDQVLTVARPGAVVLDLCCGSGAIGAAIGAAVPGIDLHAVDVDPAAVRCARSNVTGRVHEGDLYAPLPSELRGRVDVLVANAPYVPTAAIATMPPEARDHEPPVALDGGADGLDVARRVIAGAGDWLAPGGRLFVETGAHQAAALAEVYSRNGLTARVVRSDELDATVVVGVRGAAG